MEKIIWMTGDFLAIELDRQLYFKSQRPQYVYNVRNGPFLSRIYRHGTQLYKNNSEKIQSLIIDTVI